MSRRGHRKRRSAGVIRQLPWQQVRNPWSPVEALEAEQVETIVEAALTILETQGFRFLEEESRRLLGEAGADANSDNSMVRFDRDHGHGTNLPWHRPRFGLRARNPAHNLKLGTAVHHTVFASVGGPAFVSDLDQAAGGPATYDGDVRLPATSMQSLNIIHQEGGGRVRGDGPAGRSRGTWTSTWRNVHA